MTKSASIFMGKTVRALARLRGGGSALPGLFVEKIDKNFVRDTLAQLHYGVVIISGTNGKTTTTKMVVELLESQGLKVFTNRTGSNFSRGVAAALLAEVNRKGRLKADIAVLELDEAHAVHFVKQVPPKYCLLLNVMRDQLDRFGEIDTTARMLAHIANATTDTIVVNREDPRLLKVARVVKKDTVYYGLDPSLRSQFPTDDELRGKATRQTKPPKAEVTLDSFNKVAHFTVADKQVKTRLALTGIYNVFNAAAAIALVRTVMGADVSMKKLLERLATVQPAFGRGEKLLVDSKPLELVLVKNPSGFRLGLESFSPKKYATMIAINDNYADGRDMSWLWDVEFGSLREGGVKSVAGIRAYDMALRLQYDKVAFDDVNTDIKQALKYFIKSNDGKPKRIYCSYTAMLQIRKLLSKITKVEVVS